jgi:hypothetical protein
MPNRKKALVQHHRPFQWLKDISVVARAFLPSIRWRVARRCEPFLLLALLTGKRVLPIFGYEISDKLSAFSDEYKSDNLPITYRGKVPDGEIDTQNDGRLFVRQLREIGVSSARIRNAIRDYYRAYEQRSAWARENLLVSGEVEEYEDRLEDEWSRYRDVVFETLDHDSAESVLRDAGQRLYRWADLESGNLSTLRIREMVTEPYVVRGGFHSSASTISSTFSRLYSMPNPAD